MTGVLATIAMPLLRRGRPTHRTLTAEELHLGSAGLDALRAKSAKAVRERIDHLTPAQADAVEAELG